LSATATARKDVPQPKALRERIALRAGAIAALMDPARAPARGELDAAAAALLAEWGLPAAYVGWTMVALASAFWRQQVAAVPCTRRLLLLPQCLRQAETCPAPCDAAGLSCRGCGGCPLAGLQAQAQALGYRVLVAEGSPAVMQIILSGQADAILGVACLDVLENTFDKILLAGIPCMAVPLLGNGCRNTATDEDWVARMIHTPHRPTPVSTCTYLHLMRATAAMFAPAELARLLALPNPRNGPDFRLAKMGLSPSADAGRPLSTPAIAADFLAAGGKHSRPFITLAVYDALTGGGATGADGARAAAQLPDAVRRIALAIEIFHKASLVHDDVEDDDPLRYGLPAVHRKHGVAAAVNVGDYLIGLGYRLVAAQRQPLGAAAADILAVFADAHTRLCEGQGAELSWRDRPDRELTPLEALRISALKTAPAFEAALMAGVRLAGPVAACREEIARFARHLGAAYQIVNDLDDWQPSQTSGRPGGDLLHGRPTVLWALAMANLPPRDRLELKSLVRTEGAGALGATAGLPSSAGNTVGQANRGTDHSAWVASLERARGLYEQAGVFSQAGALVSKHHARARAAVDRLPQGPLRHLLYFLADAILDRRPLGTVPIFAAEGRENGTVPLARP
jgi:geranylgeranyl pyrophosphate synthase